MNSKKYSSDCSSRICFNKAALVACLVGLTAFFSCTPALYKPSAKEVSSTSSLYELKTGRNIYVHKCASCHTLYLPEKYTKIEWQHWLNKMSQKVYLDSIEKERVLKYLGKGK